MHQLSWMQKWFHLNSKLYIQYWKRKQTAENVQDPTIPIPLCCTQHLATAAAISIPVTANIVSQTQFRKCILISYKRWAQWYNSTTDKSELTTEKTNSLLLRTSLVNKIFKSHRKYSTVNKINAGAVKLSFKGLSLLLPPTPHGIRLKTPTRSTRNFLTRKQVCIHAILGTHEETHQQCRSDPPAYYFVLKKGARRRKVISHWPLKMMSNAHRNKGSTSVNFSTA